MGHGHSTLTDETIRRAALLEEHLCDPGTEFGDSTVILGRVTSILELCLGVVAEAAGKPDPEVFESLAPKRRADLVLDPSYRRIIQDAFEAVCRNEAPDAAWPDVVRRADAPESRRSVRLAGTLSLYDPTVRPLDNRLAAQIQAVLTAQPGGPEGCAVPVAGEGQLEAAEAVLTTVVPQLWGSVRRHIQLVVAASDAPFKSGSDRRLPGTVFVDTEVFGRPELLSEALLHEGVHQKLYDIYLQAPVLEAAYDPESSPRLRAPWHTGSDRAPEWPVDNVLAAMHVYAHLAVLRARQRLETYDEIGPPYASALSRAVYLAEALRTGRAGRLGPSGAAMVEWLWQGLTGYAGLEAGSAA